MKTSILLVLAILISPIAQAQLLGGFFSQKNENKKRLIEQIAALQVYKEYLQKGYNIASTGLTTINKIKSGDFGLHRNYFNALKIVNPKVKNYSKVADLIDLNIKAIACQKKIKAMLKHKDFSGDENYYINQVLQSILEAISDTLDELIAIISDNQLELKDDERINRIDGLYIQMKEQYGFIRAFSDDVANIRLQKHKEFQQINQSMILNDLN
jgi:hypothetical protein